MNFSFGKLQSRYYHIVTKIDSTVVMLACARKPVYGGKCWWKFCIDMTQ